MRHRKIRDLCDQVIHARSLDVFFGVARHHRERGHNETAIAMCGVKRDLIVA